jgi:hypothetical protein
LEQDQVAVVVQVNLEMTERMVILEMMDHQEQMALVLLLVILELQVLRGMSA